VALRYGGEEFVLILPGMTRDVSAKVCERLRKRIQDFDWAATRDGMSVTVSIGLAGDVCPADLAEVLARADVCLYAAKNGGRNQLRIDAR
jgi:diguanylate cyclase (GGDEF)-like protein